MTRTPESVGRVELLGQFTIHGHGQWPYAKGGTADTAKLHEIVEYGLGDVDGNGEADAGVAAAGRGDHGVDADHLAVRVEQGAAGVAGINGSVGLDGLVDVGSVRLLHLADGADDAAGHGSVEDAEGIADGEHLLADLEAGAAAQGYGLQVRGLDLNDRKIVRFVGADDGGRIVLLVFEDDFQLPRVRR